MKDPTKTWLFYYWESPNELNEACYLMETPADISFYFQENHDFYSDGTLIKVRVPDDEDLVDINVLNLLIGFGFPESIAKYIVFAGTEPYPRVIKKLPTSPWNPDEELEPLDFH